MALLLLATAASVASISAAAACAPPCHELATEAPIAAVDARFLSVTMDGHAFDRGREPMDFWRPGSKLTRALAGALQPAFIRFGGSSHSALTYNMSGRPLPPALPPLPPPAYQPPAPTTAMSAAQWREINAFCSAVGWTNLFALNALLRVADGSESGRWDSGPQSAAAQLLRYTFAQKDWAPVVWELANEPDLFHYAYKIADHSVFPVPPRQLVRDHAALRALIASLSPAAAQQPLLVVGPDGKCSRSLASCFGSLKEAAAPVANAGPTGGEKYWREYFGNQSAVAAHGVDAATWHHY